MVEILTPVEALETNLTISECRFGGRTAVDIADKTDVTQMCRTCKKFVSFFDDEDRTVRRGEVCKQVEELRVN